MTTPSAHPRPNYGGVFISLFLLTMLEIFVANLPMARLPIILGLVFLAIVKATLVAMFYMHLRFEKVLLIIIAVAPLAFSMILTIAVGHDIGHPHP